MIRLSHPIIHDDLEITYYKIKPSNKKIELNKAQYNLDKETSKISALSSRNLVNLNL